MNYVESLNLFGVEAKEIPCIKGEGEPTTNTEGAVGCFYMNTLNGDIYKCVSVNAGNYKWDYFVTPISVVEDCLVGDGLILEDGESTIKSVNHTYEQMASVGLTGYFAEDGTLTAYDNNYVSDFIEVTKGSTVQYSVNAIGTISKVMCYYDAEKKLIGSVTASGTRGSFTAQIGEITLPDGAVYIRISMAKIATTDDINLPSKQFVIYSIDEPSSGLPVLRVDPKYFNPDGGDVVEKLEDTYIETTATGKLVTVTDAIATNLRGVTVNDGTQVENVKVIGKNFFNRHYDRAVSNIGVTVEWDAENQEFIFNGTTTAAGDIKLVTPMTIDWLCGENYTVSIRHISGTATLAEGSAATTYAWGIFQDNAARFIRGATSYTEFNDLYNFTGKAFELDTNRSYILYFQCWRPGTVFDNYRVKIQIEQGSLVTDWEEYREEIATLEEVQTLHLQDGYNNIITSPMADITIKYAIKTKAYIDNIVNCKTAWDGKKWFAFGTSITDTDYINAETGTPTGKYVPYLAEMSGMSVTNCGIAGGTWGKGGTHGGSANILNRILSTDLSSADLITIEGCVNDFACAVPIGELGDTGGTDAVADTETITICGSLYRAVKHCLETAPNAVVILLTESTGKEYTLKNGQTANYCVNKKNSLGLFQKDYNDVTIEMGRFMGVRVIDAGSKSQINCFKPEYIVDQIHHTELGGKQYAETIWDELKNIHCNTDVSV